MSASQSDSESEEGSGASSAERESIRLLVNGEAHSIAAPASVASLLGALDMAGRRVAVAVDRSVVVRSAYAETHLSDGDRIEILEAVGGG